MIDNTKLVRFLLTLLLGWIGSYVINHTFLKPEGYTSRSWHTYFFLTIITLGVYGVIAAIMNLTFDPSRENNIGYKKD